jgi:hypothetical protein
LTFTPEALLTKTLLEELSLLGFFLSRIHDYFPLLNLQQQWNIKSTGKLPDLREPPDSNLTINVSNTLSPGLKPAHI